MGDQSRVTPKGDILPKSLPPVGISRPEAAALVGVSTSKFDEMVADGRMPGPKKIDGRTVTPVRGVVCRGALFKASTIRLME